MSNMGWSTRADANCAFNAFAIGLWDGIRTIRIQTLPDGFLRGLTMSFIFEQVMGLSHSTAYNNGSNNAVSMMYKRTTAISRITSLRATSEENIHIYIRYHE